MFAIRPGRAGLRRVRTPNTPRAAGRDDLGNTIAEEDRAHLDEVERIRNARAVWEYRDLVNRERYDGTDGQHYWTNDPLTGVPTPPDEAKPDWRVEWACPDLQSTIQQYAAAISTSPVKYAGEPKADTVQARMAASASARCIASMRRTMKSERKRNAAALRAMVGGECFGVVFWDEGRGCSDFVKADAHEIFYRLGVESFEDSPWVDRELWEPIETTRARWAMPPKGAPDDPVTRKRRAAARKVREIKPSVTNMPAIVRERIAMTGGVDTTVAEEDLKTFVRHLDHFELPCDDYPRGRWQVFVNDTLIYEQDELPYFRFGIRIPIVRLAFFPIPGRARALGMMQLGFSTQALIEDMVNAQIEHQRLMVWGKVIYDERIDLDGKWTTEPGEAVPVPMQMVGQDAIKVIRPPPLDPTAMRLPIFLAEKQSQQLGANDPNRGIVNKDVTLGEVQIAQAAGEVRMQAFYRDVDTWERDILEMALVLEQGMASEDRLRDMIGADRDAELRAFQESRFIDTEDGPRTVELVAQSAPSLSNNDAVREQQVAARMKLGLITKEQALDVLEMPLPPGAITTSWEDNKRLLRELVTKVRRGEHVQVHPLWDHGAMLQAAGQIVTQRDFLDSPPEQQAAVNKLFMTIEDVFAKRNVGAAMMRGDRAAGGSASAAAIGSAGGSSSPQGVSEPGVLTDTAANSIGSADGPADLGIGDAGAGDAAALGY